MKKYKSLYLECSAGISGDMFVASMLDLGADEKKLKRALESLPLDEFDTVITRVKKAGIDALDFDVRIDAPDAGRDHDMEYLHGSHYEEHGHDHSHYHGNEHGHHHEHSHDHPHEHHEHEHSHDHHHEHRHHHSHGGADHVHRHLPDILEIIDAADITDDARALAVKIFQILAEAEAKAHGIPADEVHFHEVGAVDSIVDIISAAVCFCDLSFDNVYIIALSEGRGTVRCAHGVLPVPVPAVSNILADKGIAINIIPSDGEFITPTGAAIAAAIRTDDKLPGSFVINRIGIGAGKRTYERPSLLRAMEIEHCEGGGDLIYRLETDIDDVSGEALGYTMEKLMEAGARDVHFTPVFMKKNRPGTELVVICEEDKISAMENIIFNNTTTIGIRRVPMERTVLPRRTVTRKTDLGDTVYKQVTLPDGSMREYPEYDSVREQAEEYGVDFHTAIDLALRRK